MRHRQNTQYTVSPFKIGVSQDNEYEKRENCKVQIIGKSDQGTI